MRRVYWPSSQRKESVEIRWRKSWWAVPHPPTQLQGPPLGLCNTSSGVERLLDPEKRPVSLPLQELPHLELVSSLERSDCMKGRHTTKGKIQNLETPAERWKVASSKDECHSGDVWESGRTFVLPLATLAILLAGFSYRINIHLEDCRRRNDSLNLKLVRVMVIKRTSSHTSQRLASCGWLARSSPRVRQVAEFWSCLRMLVLHSLCNGPLTRWAMSIERVKEELLRPWLVVFISEKEDLDNEPDHS